MACKLFVPARGCGSAAEASPVGTPTSNKHSRTRTGQLRFGIASPFLHTIYFDRLSRNKILIAALRALFDRVVVITPRECIAQKTALVTRQGILRRFHEKRIETIALAEPRWSESFNEGKLEYANVYNGEAGVIADVAFFAYSAPRVAEDMLAGPLRAAGIEVHLVGDCRSPGGLLAATSEGHAAGNAI